MPRKTKPNQRPWTKNNAHISAVNYAQEVEEIPSKHSFDYHAKPHVQALYGPSMERLSSERDFVLPPGKRVIVLMDTQATRQLLPLHQKLPDHVTLIPCITPDQAGTVASESALTLVKQACNGIKRHQMCVATSTLDNTSTMIAAMTDICGGAILDEDADKYFVWVSDCPKAPLAVRSLNAYAPNRCCLVSLYYKQIETVLGYLKYDPSSINNLVEFLAECYVPNFRRIYFASAVHDGRQ